MKNQKSSLSGSEMRGFFRAFATETTETDTETANCQKNDTEYE